MLSKINRSIGTRAESARAPRTYEMPPEVVTEAIVNAVVHRDYTDNGSVQVMLFADRLEVRNPGRLPPSLTLEKLREAHRSVPGNPLVGEALYLTEYIERMGTGTLDMIRRCVEGGWPSPSSPSPMVSSPRFRGWHFPGKGSGKGWGRSRDESADGRSQTADVAGPGAKPRAKPGAKPGAKSGS